MFSFSTRSSQFSSRLFIHPCGQSHILGEVKDIGGHLQNWQDGEKGSAG